MQPIAHNESACMNKWTNKRVLIRTYERIGQITFQFEKKRCERNGCEWNGKDVREEDDDDAGEEFVNVIKRTLKAQYHSLRVMLRNKVNGIHCCNDNGKTASPPPRPLRFKCSAGNMLIDELFKWRRWKNHSILSNGEQASERTQTHHTAQWQL